MASRIEPPTAAELAELSRDMTRQQMADHYKVHINTMRNWLRAYGMTRISQHVPKTTADKIKQMAEQRMCASEIAAALGINPATVGVIAKAVGITISKKRDAEREDWVRWRAEAAAVVVAYKEARKEARKAAGEARRAYAQERKKQREETGKRLYRKPNYFGVVRPNDPFGLAHASIFGPSQAGNQAGNR